MDKTPTNNFNVDSSDSTLRHNNKETLNKIEKTIKDAKESKRFNENLFNKMKQLWPLSKVSGRIFLIYTLIVLVGGFFLTIPGVSTNSLFHWDFLTGVFTASSAFSDTGITISNASSDYSFWGQLIILILIELGGIGVLTFKIVLYLAINRRISLNDTITAQSERGSSIKANTIVMIRDGFIFLTIVQAVAAIFLFFVFFFTEPGNVSDTVLNNSNTGINLGTISPKHNFVKSLWFAIFHSTSAINNAGFDIISGSSLQSYNVDGHRSYLIQMIFLIEWVIGGLGYPTFHDIKRKIVARRNGTTAKFSLFTKLNFCIYGMLFIVGPLLVFASEYINLDQSMVLNKYSVDGFNELGQSLNPKILEQKPWAVGLMDIFFNATSSRNAGFSSININDFNAGSKLILSIMMFIGSAPSSTAGGIRTTTLAIILLANFAIIKNQKHTSAFKKTIPEETVKRAFAVFFISVALVTISTLIIYIDSAPVVSNQINGNNAIIEILTLISSAFGTVGLNPFSSTQMLQMGVLTKLTMIFMMFFGQLGISNTLLVFIKPSRKRRYQYLEEEVTIG